MECIWLYAIICQWSMFKNIIMALHKLWNFNLPFLYIIPEILQSADILDFPVQPSTQKEAAESGKQQPRTKPWMQKVYNLKPILKIRRKILINPPQHRNSRIIILRLRSTMNIQNTERTFRQLSAQLEANIPLQPLATDNRSWEELADDPEDAIAEFVGSLDAEGLESVEIGEVLVRAIVPDLVGDALGWREEGAGVDA